jgi:hypothetical protein
VRVVGMALTGLLMACSGDDETAIPAPTCDGLTTSPFGMVEVTEWPAGTIEAADALLAVPGRYATVDSCSPGVEVFVKVQSPTERESIDLVTEPYADGPCGCTSDSSYSADSEYAMVGLMAGSSFFVENGFEAGAVGSTVNTDLVLFGEGSPLVVRACGSAVIEPFRGSAYDSIEVAMRVLNGQVYEGNYTLVNDEESVSCELTAWTLVAVE